MPVAAGEALSWRGDGEGRAATARRLSAACDFDTAAATELHSHSIGLAPAGDDLGAGLSSPEALRSAEVVASHFHPPASVSLPFWARVVSGPDSVPPGHTHTLSHGLDDFFVLSFRKDGHLFDRDVAREDPEQCASDVSHERAPRGRR